MDFSDIGIGMNLRLGIRIWYRYEFWVSVSGIGIGLIFGYRYRYGSSAGYRYGYRYQGIGGTLLELSWQVGAKVDQIFKNTQKQPINNQNKVVAEVTPSSPLTYHILTTYSQLTQNLLITHHLLAL